MSIRHPAQYNKKLLPAISRYASGSKRILDPMAGVGNIFRLPEYNQELLQAEICAVEIEPEWAIADSRITVGSVLSLPWSDNYFDCVVCSPPYGNRMADRRTNGKWADTRISYAVYLGRELSDGNAASLKWGDKYREFHLNAWAEVKRVLSTDFADGLGGKFVLNIKDHYRNNEVQDVTGWHISALSSLGFVMVDRELVTLNGARYGRNYNSRVDFESVILFRLPKK